MSEGTVQAVNEAGERYGAARERIIEALNDPEAPAGSLSTAAHQAEAARSEYEAAVHEHQAELEAGL